MKPFKQGTVTVPGYSDNSTVLIVYNMYIYVMCVYDKATVYIVKYINIIKLITNKPP